MRFITSVEPIQAILAYSLRFFVMLRKNKTPLKLDNAPHTSRLYRRQLIMKTAK